nr:FAD-dependent oxidoreductase [Hyphomonas sp. Mor2]
MSEPRFDAIVIGGGLAGTTSFLELTRRGLSVLLIDANKQIADGASYANGGMLTASMADPWNGPGVFKHILASLFDPKAAMKLRFKSIPEMVPWGVKFLANSTPHKYANAVLQNFLLAKFSLEATKTLVQDLNQAHLVAESGTLKVFENHSAFAEQLNNAERLAKEGLRFQVLNPDDVREIEPNLSGTKINLVKGIYYPDDMVGDARAFCIAVADEAKKSGGQIWLDTLVETILVENGQVVGVRSKSRTAFANKVIVAAGDASPKLVKPMRIGLAIKPVKGYSITFNIHGDNHRPKIPIIDDAMHAAVTPIGDKLRVVGTAEFTGKDKRLSQSRLDNLMALLARVYPEISVKLDTNSGEAWTGFRPMSADGLAYVGPTHISGLWLNTGHGHLGWTMAVGSSRILAQQMFGDTPSINPKPFFPNRSQ